MSYLDSNVRRIGRLPFSFAALLVLSSVFGAGCASPVYRAARVGYSVEAPSGFYGAAEHQELQMKDSVLGPIDLAVTRFGDGYGGSDVYLALGIRGSFALARNADTVAELDRGLRESLAKVGPVISSAAVHEDGLLGEDLEFKGTGKGYEGRDLRIRVLIGVHAAYFVMAAADSDSVDKPTLVKRRTDFFSQFHPTSAEGGAREPMSATADPAGLSGIVSRIFFAAPAPS